MPLELGRRQGRSREWPPGCRRRGRNLPVGRSRPGSPRKFAEEGLSPHAWGNGPNHEYGWHSHDYHKVLYCVSGAVVFHTEEGDFELEPGDRLDVPPGTDHAATVGPEGVRCMEAAK